MLLFLLPFRRDGKQVANGDNVRRHWTAKLHQGYFRPLYLLVRLAMLEVCSSVDCNCRYCYFDSRPRTSVEFKAPGKENVAARYR
jgi:hypothetical protein